MISFQMCADFGDCCPDYQDVCGTAFADECEDREASVSNQAGKKKDGPYVRKRSCSIMTKFRFLIFELLIALHERIIFHNKLKGF